MKRTSRTLAGVVSGAMAVTGLLVAVPGTAHADVIGQVTLSPTSGVDSTIFGGSVTAACPAGTDYSEWQMSGPSFATPFYLGDGLNNGVGAQSFSGASIANIETANGGPLTTGMHQVAFQCFTGGSTPTDSYRINFDYNNTGSGSWTTSAATLTPIATGTVLSHDAGAGVEAGTTVNLTADVTPASGPDAPAGSVEFFDGATSLGVDNTAAAGGIFTLAVSTLPQGARSITAVFTAAAPSGPNDRGFSSSTSPAQTVQVNAVAPRSTTSVLSVAPTTGPAYQSVTLDCDVTPSTGTAAGTVNFLDGANNVGSASTGTANGAATRYSIASTAFGAGSHSFTCAFVGTAPYQNSTSAAVPATYDVVGATPDEQTVTVTIPQGVLTITTPYTPAAPLHLGSAVLENSDSTYSASATFGTAAEGYINITDTRAGNLGWTASLISGAYSNGTSTFPGVHSGLNGLSALQVAGNALQATNVALTNNNPFTPGLGVSRQFASYAAGLPTGSVNITGTFGVDQVPTSITPGLYTATVTFTAV